MTRTDEILDAVARSLSIKPGDLRFFLIFLLLAGIVLALAVLIQHAIVRRRETRTHEERFQNEIRRLNLTILELDVIDRLSAFLRDPHKRVLLLLNRSTFTHCSRSVGALPERLSAAHRHLSKRLGFADGGAIPGSLGAFIPAAGTSIKLELPETTGRLVARVVSAEIDQITATLAEASSLETATEVNILASHPSGLVEARGLVVENGAGRLVLQLTQRFHVVSRRDFADRRLRIQIKRDGSENPPTHAELLRISRAGSDIVSPEERYRKGDAVRIFIHRGQDARAAINAEVRRARRRGHTLRVRFSHLSAAVWEAVLGSSKRP